jgi:hypothetical protein
VEALRLVGDLLDVLSAAHSAGVIHGGLTTSEVFIADDGSVRVFGLGAGEVRQRVAERRGCLALAAGFAAPERIADPRRPADESADVWSAAAILFALLTGEVPYEGRTDAERSANALERPPRSLTELYDETPIVLARLVDTALDPDPQRRFGTTRMRSLARETAQLPELFLLRDLKSHQSSSPVSGPRRSPSARAVAPFVPKVAGPIELRTAETLPAFSAPTRRRAAADTIPALPSVDTPPPSAQRRRVADVLVGEATSSEGDVRMLTDLFAELSAVLGERLRGGELAIEPLAARAVESLAASTGGYVWNVAPWGFFAGAHPLWEPTGDLARVPYELYAAGVRSFGLLPGIEQRELARFVEILLQPPSPDGDCVTALYEAGFEHLVFRAVEPRGALSGPRRREAIRERQQAIAFAGFDTSTQLEECWYDAHKGASPLRTELPAPLAAADESKLAELAARFQSEARPDARRVCSAALAALSIPFAKSSVEAQLRAALDTLASSAPAYARHVARRLAESSTTLGQRASSEMLSLGVDPGDTLEEGAS